MQCCPAKALAWMTQIRTLAWMTQIRTRIRVCQRIMQTPARLLIGLGKSSKANVWGNFQKEKCGWGKHYFYRPILKLNPLKKSYYGR